MTTCSTGRSTRIDAATNVSSATSIPRRKPPRENASRSSSGDAGEDSWSSIDRWNFCCRIDEALFVKLLIAQAIMISPGMMKTT